MNQVSRRRNINKSKAEFLRILLGESLESIDNTDISFEWMNPDIIMSLGTHKSGDTYIRINLNFGEDEIFKGEEEDYSLVFRAYFISSYIEYLTTVTKNNPDSYFEGLVQLSAINILIGTKKTYAYIYKNGNRVRFFRPIDAYCNIDALRRIQHVFGDRLSDDSKGRLENYLGRILTFAALPEIEYIKKRPVYSLSSELKKFEKIAGKNHLQMFKYPLFKENGLADIGDITFDKLIAASEKCCSPFWAGAILRLALCIHTKRKIRIGIGTFSEKYATDFESDLVNYYLKNQELGGSLLTDNTVAIKRLAGRIEKVFDLSNISSGMVHYYT